MTPPSSSSVASTRTGFDLWDLLIRPPLLTDAAPLKMLPVFQAVSWGAGKLFSPPSPGPGIPNPLFRPALFPSDVWKDRVPLSLQSAIDRLLVKFPSKATLTPYLLDALGKALDETGLTPLETREVLGYLQARIAHHQNLSSDPRHRNRELLNLPVLLENREKQLELPGTAVVSEKIKEREKKGKVYRFSLGENTFYPIEAVDQSIQKALLSGNAHRYSAARGQDGALFQVQRLYAERDRVKYPKENIHIVPGGKFGVWNILAGLVGPKTAVIVPTPSWTYEGGIALNHGQYSPLSGDPQNSFKITASLLEARILELNRQGKGVGVLVLNNPHNPTGAIYTENELRSIAEVALKYGVEILSDEPYEGLEHPGHRSISIASLRDVPLRDERGNILSFHDMKYHVFRVNVGTKLHSLAGDRIGWVITPELDPRSPLDPKERERRDNIYKAAVIAAGGVNNLSQAGLEAALGNYADALQQKRDPYQHAREEFQKRTELGVRLLNEGLDLPTKQPQAAFYALADVQKYIGASYVDEKGEEHFIRNDRELADYVLEKSGVAVIPASYLGLDGVRQAYWRFSFGSTRTDQIQEGLKELKKALNGLNPHPIQVFQEDAHETVQRIVKLIRKIPLPLWPPTPQPQQFPVQTRPSLPAQIPTQKVLYKRSLYPSHLPPPITDFWKEVELARQGQGNPIVLKLVPLVRLIEGNRGEEIENQAEILQENERLANDPEFRGLLTQYEHYYGKEDPNPRDPNYIRHSILNDPSLRGGKGVEVGTIVFQKGQISIPHPHDDKNGKPIFGTETSTLNDMVEIQYEGGKRRIVSYERGKTYLVQGEHQVACVGGWGCNALFVYSPPPKRAK